MSYCNNRVVKWASRRTLATVVALAAACVVPIGILSDTAGAAKPNLSAKLLSISQMPTGWAVYNGPTNGLGCLANTLEPKGIKQTAGATVEFENNGSLPAVVERLVTFANAKAGYKKIIANLARCKKLSGTSDGQKFAGTVGPASFPHFGDTSAAFEANFTVQGESLTEDLVVIRKGNIVMGIDEGDIPPVDVGQFQGFLTKALAKLP